MADTGFVPKEKWKSFIEGLAKDAKVYVPCIEGETVVFQPFGHDKTLCFERPANSPPKPIIYPQSETLFQFVFKKDPEDPQKVSTELTAKTDALPTIIVGGRPCDAKGFSIYDRVFLNTDTADPYYKERREKTTIVTLACQSTYPGCFCTSLGGSPSDRTDSDVLVTEVNGGYLVEPLTEKGKSLAAKADLEDGAPYQKEAQEKQAAVEKAVKNPFGTTGKPAISKARFDDDAFWDQALAKCLSCGACTYLCPTCYCFNITDEQAINKGERVRSWDACMFPHFTLEASGHNPRPRKQQRYKNRVGHKFVWYPEKYNGAIQCSGCGRCIRYCPVSVDISEIVALLGKPAKENTEQAAKGGENVDH
jgi:sulfhydrogenase subunit beta (sulfur reductase)